MGKHFPELEKVLETSELLAAVKRVKARKPSGKPVSEELRKQLEARQVGSRLNLLAATDQKTELLRFLEYDHNALVESQHQLEALVSTRNGYGQQWLDCIGHDIAGHHHGLATGKAVSQVSRQEFRK